MFHKHIWTEKHKRAPDDKWFSVTINNVQLYFADHTVAIHYRVCDSCGKTEELETKIIPNSIVGKVLGGEVVW